MSPGTAREADRKGETSTQEVLGKGVVEYWREEEGKREIQTFHMREAGAGAGQLGRN